MSKMPKLDGKPKIKNGFTELSLIGDSSKKEHVVNRKWTNKAGENKSKTYVYTESELLFRKTKSGYKVIDKSWEQFEKKINETIKDPVDRASILNEARRIKGNILYNEGQYDTAVVSKRHYQSARQKGWNRIDVQSMISRIVANRWEKYIINMGLSVAEICVTYNITREQLLADANWTSGINGHAVWNGITIKGNNITLQFQFDYNGMNNITAEGGDVEV